MQTYIPNICSQICGKSIDIQTDILYNQCKQLFGNYVRNPCSEYVFETEVPHMYTFEEVNAMLNEDTYYFVLFFIFDNKNKKWLIFDLKERG